jgi:hypothetical protein
VVSCAGRLCGGRPQEDNVDAQHHPGIRWSGQMYYDVYIVEQENTESVTTAAKSLMNVRCGLESECWIYECASRMKHNSATKDEDYLCCGGLIPTRSTHSTISLCQPLVVPAMQKSHQQNLMQVQLNRAKGRDHGCWTRVSQTTTCRSVHPLSVSVERRCGVRSAFQSHLSALRRGIQNLKSSQEDLLRKNRRLQQEIDRLHNEADVSVQPSPIKSKGKNNPLLHMKVKELELEVRKLKKVTRFH